MKTMKEALQLEGNERLETMIRIKDSFLNGTLSLEEARTELKEKIVSCTPDEFAYGEQQLKGSYSDEEITHRMDDLLALFDGILIRADHTYPPHHPLTNYKAEINAFEERLCAMEKLLEAPHFILNPWLAIYDDLMLWRTHLHRKQNQLYAVLERYGFDRPTKIMWTFDDALRDSISESYTLLESNQIDEFLEKQRELIDICRDLNHKEEEILFPTAWKLLSEEDFITMSQGDREIGFAFIQTPELYTGTSQSSDITHHKESPTTHTPLLQELAQLLGKYGVSTSDKDSDHDVAIGKLSLEQIKLIFKFLPVDITFVDEEDIVKFYNDTKHRIFPRSANIIGRLVQNCHPKKSLPMVQEIIDTFKAGKEDYAEMWINKPHMFIHIEYIAVRNEAGQFKGILEMVQDCTHIRNLEGSRKELIWEGVNGSYHDVDHIDYSRVREETDPVEIPKDQLSLSGDTKLFPLFDEIDGLKEHLMAWNSNYKMLNSPLAKLMKSKATLSMVAERGNISLHTLMQEIMAFKSKK